MTKQSQEPRVFDPRVNRLLAMLEREDYDALMLDATVVPLKFRKRLVRQDERVNAVYFPLDAMISLLVTTDGQPQMEMATIGKEGCRSLRAYPNTRRDGSKPNSDTWYCGAD